MCANRRASANCGWACAVPSAASCRTWTWPSWNPTPVSTRRLERDPALVDELLEQLREKQPDLDSLVGLKREAGEVLPLTRDLVAVAAQLSAIHMNWWVAIVDSIRRIHEATDRQSLESAVHEMLVNIQEFDRLET